MAEDIKKTVEGEKLLTSLPVKLVSDVETQDELVTHTGILLKIQDTSKSLIKVLKKQMVQDLPSLATENETEERAKGKIALMTNKLLEKLVEKSNDKSSNFGLILTLLGGLLFSFVQQIKNAAKIFKTIFIGIPKLLGKSIQKLFAFSFLKDSKFFQGITKFIKGLKAGKIGAVFTSIGKLVQPIFKVFGTIGKFVGKLGPLLKLSKGIPVVGQVITVLFALFDGIKGFFTADKIFGVDEASIGQKFSAAIGSIISGLTFGLIGDSETWAKGIFKAFTDPMNFIRDNVFGGEGPIKGVFNLIIDAMTAIPRILLKAVDGILGFFGVNSELAKSFEKIPQFFKNVFGSIVDFFTNIFTEEGFIFSGIKNAFFGFVNFFRTIVEFYIKQFSSEGFIWMGIKGAFNFFVDIFKTFVNNLQAIPEFFKEAFGIEGEIFQGIKNSLKSFFGNIAKSAKNLGHTLTFGLFKGGEKSKVSKPTADVSGVGLSVAKASAVTLEKKIPEAKIEEIPTEISDIVIKKDSNEEERVKLLFDFLLGPFSDVQANKIALAMNVKGTNPVETGRVTIK